MSQLLKRFRALFPTPPLQVGDVIAYSNGTATIELPEGGRLQARGSTTVGARVFVRGDAIEGPAPTLTLEIIDV